MPGPPIPLHPVYRCLTYYLTILFTSYELSALLKKRGTKELLTDRREEPEHHSPSLPADNYRNLLRLSRHCSQVHFFFFFPLFLVPEVSNPCLSKSTLLSHLGRILCVFLGPKRSSKQDITAPTTDLVGSHWSSHLQLCDCR